MNLSTLLPLTVGILFLWGCQGGEESQEEVLAEPGSADVTDFSAAPFNADSFILILPETLDTITIYQQEIENLSFRGINVDTTQSRIVLIDNEEYRLFWPRREDYETLMQDNIPPTYLRKLQDDGLLSKEVLTIYNTVLFRISGGGSTIFTPRDDKPPAQTKSMGFGNLLRQRMQAAVDEGTVSAPSRERQRE